MLRFPLAVLVVYLHSFGDGINLEQLHAGSVTGMAVYDYLRIFISVVLSRSAVPLFFIFSGFLFFKGVERFDKELYVKKLRKRWRSLAVPYFVWNVFYILWVVAIKLGTIVLLDQPWSCIGDYFTGNVSLHSFWNSISFDERTTWLGVEVCSTGPALLPMWFVRDLMVLAIISPIIYCLSKKLRLVYVLSLLTLYLFDIRIPGISNNFAAAITFFSIGAYFSVNKLDFTKVLWQWRYIICPFAVALMIEQTATGSDNGDVLARIVHLWLLVAQSLALIIVASVLCRYRRLYDWNKALAGSTFFIYAFHMIIIDYIKDIVTKITPLNGTWYMHIVDYLLYPLICVALCAGIYNLGKHYFPKVMNLMVGER